MSASVQTHTASPLGPRWEDSRFDFDPTATQTPGRTEHRNEAARRTLPASALDALVADARSFHALLQAIRAPRNAGGGTAHHAAERCRIHATQTGVRFVVNDASKCLLAVVHVKAAAFVEFGLTHPNAASPSCRFDVDHGELCDAVAIVAAAISEKHNDSAGGGAIRLRYPTADGALSLVTEQPGFDGGACAYATLRTLDTGYGLDDGLDGDASAFGATFDRGGAATFDAETALLKEAMEEMDITDTRVRIELGALAAASTSSADVASQMPQECVRFTGAGPQGRVAVDICAGPQCTLTLPDKLFDVEAHRRGHAYQYKHLKRAFARLGDVLGASAGAAQHGFGFSSYNPQAAGGFHGPAPMPASSTETRAQVSIDTHGTLQAMHLITWQTSEKLSAFRTMAGLAPAEPMPAGASGMDVGDDDAARALVATVRFEVLAMVEDEGDGDGNSM